MRRYFAELDVLVGGSSVFNVLAHCDYPRRYWPTGVSARIDDSDFEEEYRTVFRTLASSGRALEINTRSPMASVSRLRWWWEEGGDAVLVRQRCAPAVPGRRALRRGGRRRGGGGLQAWARPVRLLAAVNERPRH